MKLSLYRHAREALRGSLNQGKVDPNLVEIQVRILSQHNSSERLKLLRIYRKLLETKLNEEQIHVHSPGEIEVGEKENLSKILREKFGKDKNVIYHTDPELIGGIKIRQKDNLFDYSISGKLSQIKEAFV